MNNLYSFQLPTIQALARNLVLNVARYIEYQIPVRAIDYQTLETLITNIYEKFRLEIVFIQSLYIKLSLE